MAILVADPSGLTDTIQVTTPPVTVIQVATPGPQGPSVLPVGTIIITGGANGNILFDNNGVLGELSILPTTFIPGLTGDVTSASGSVATTISAGVVTNAKLATAPATTLKGNPTGGVAAVQDLTLGATLAFSGTSLQTGALSGDVTSSANSFATTIAANVVTNAKLAQMAANTLKGNPTGALANAQDLTLGATLAFVTTSLQTAALTGDVTSSANSFATTIAANAVTNAKMAQMAAHTYKGNNTGATANAIDLTATQLTAELNVVVGDSGAGGTKGLVPAAGAGDAAAGKYLNAGGAFSIPTAQTVVEAQGRLTLTTGTPVMTSTVSAATTIYYTPTKGRLAPFWNGTVFIAQDVGGELSQLLSDATKSPAAAAAATMYDMFLWLDGGTYRCTRGPAWTNDTTRSQALSRVNGILVNGGAITNGPASGYGTYVGTIRTDAGGATCSWIFGASAAGGTAGWFGVWNYYNRVDVTSMTADSNNSWTYALTAWRASDNSNNMRCSFVRGVAEDAVHGRFTAYPGVTAATTTFGVCGIGLDSTTALAANSSSVTSVYAGASTNTTVISTAIFQDMTVSAGFHYIQAIEVCSNANSVTFFGNAGNVIFKTGLFFSMRM